MKLLYTITVPTRGSVTLQIPYGISSCKMRMGTNGMVENVGFVSSAGVNQTTDIKFPIINGKVLIRLTYLKQALLNLLPHSIY